MFLSETHLPQLLTAERYFTADHHKSEWNQLFLPGWHCVGTTAELAASGDYFTTDLLGRPILAWSCDGEVHAFLNVCAHRFSLLTDSPCGNMPQLKCRYHGWEYDKFGDTKRIPDAQSFKPLKRGQLGLTKLKCETIGRLIFVSLNPDPLPLADFLGDGYDLCKSLFPDASRLVLAARRDNHANWKVSLENSLEGYHLEEVHSSTFGGFPDAGDCRHELHDANHSSLWVESKEETRLTRLAKWVSKVAGIEGDATYHQFHCYPNLVFAKFGIFSWMEAVYPISPTDSYDTWRFFSNAVDPSTAKGKLVNAALKAWGKRWFQRVIDEDERIFPSIQQGLQSPLQPGGGLVSIREERVFHFQNFILDRTKDVDPNTTAATAPYPSTGCSACS
jgi:phenylpropionate dioxygenase-like ring-hydroxylating dioxygenase large terminal subunit